MPIASPLAVLFRDFLDQFGMHYDALALCVATGRKSQHFVLAIDGGVEVVLAASDHGI